MAPLITPLDAPTGPLVSLLIKLNGDLLEKLRECALKNKIPKLVVKDGLYTIRIDDDEIPCPKIPEHLNVDIYSLSDSRFNGRVSTKLNPITDEKKIAEYKKELERKSQIHEATTHVTTQPSKPVSTPSSSPKKKHLNEYLCSANSPASTVSKFLHFVALGPIPIAEVGRQLQIPQDQLQKLAAEYTQVWQLGSLNKSDRYPRVERKKYHLKHGTNSGDEDEELDLMAFDSDNQDDDNKDYIIEGSHLLKDKAYKELKPWEWNAYSRFERRLVLANINRALTRLGYLDTHPLRRKITEQGKPDIALDEENRRSGLGGGLLITKKNVPFRKSHTDSPKIPAIKEPQLDKKPQSVANSPKVAKRKFSSSSGGSTGSNGSSSSSDDEKLSKKHKVEYTSPSLEEEKVVPENKVSRRVEYYTNLASKFKVKYKEYEQLYKRLKQQDERDADKKTLVKLFELHNLLSQWKKSLWDYEKEIQLKERIMALSKHKKTQRVAKQTKLKALDY